MKGIILAGGLGTRLHPVTLEMPKSLLTVRKKPIINYLIDLFTKHGLKEIIILANKSQENDFSWWQKRHGSGLPNVHLQWESTLRGTFGGLRDLQLNETFLLTNGDELKDFNLQELINFHKNHKEKPAATIALVKVENPQDYGVPIMNEDKIEKFLEKPKDPPSKYISSGLYILEPEVLKYADWSKDFLMIETDIFPKLAAAGKLYGWKAKKGRWQDCGTLERWEKAIKEW